MDKLTDLLLSQLGVAGAFLIALAMYLLKKEVYFAQERKDFIKTITDLNKDLKDRNRELQEAIGKQHDTTISIVQNTVQAESSLRGTIAELSANVIRLETTILTAISEMRQRKSEAIK